VKRYEVIQKLKDGGTIIYSQGFTSDSFFAKSGETVNVGTTLWLLENDMVNERESKTAHGMSYLTWKARM